MSHDFNFIATSITHVIAYLNIFSFDFVEKVIVSRFNFEKEKDISTCTV